MALFKKRGPQASGEPAVGICNGKFPGNLGIWGLWSDTTTEIFRVVVRARSGSPIPETSYTFIPGFDRPFHHSLEASYELRNLLRGVKRSKEGTVTLDFLGSGGVT